MGQCGPFVVSWFFDRYSHHCKMFNHTICGGGGNQFRSELECQQVCRHNRAAMPCPKCAQKINEGQSFGITHGNGMLPGTSGPHGQPGYPFVPGEHLKPARFGTEGAPSMPSLPSRTNLPPPPAQVVSPYRPTIPGSHPRNNIPSEHASIPANTHRVLKPSLPNEPITKPVSPSVRGGPNTPIQGGQPSKPFDLSDAL
uniref:Pancreatic trypsin inhibitor n=1 Tax=Rhipicephalus appendiculatus TaxID=34631 RepID=A0A131YSQ8_RHIAP